MADTNIDDDVVSTTGTADFLGTKVKPLRQWRSAGLGPAFIKYGAAKSSPVRYELSELRRFRKAHRVTGTSRCGQKRKQP
jgi:hypothetical protein